MTTHGKLAGFEYAHGIVRHQQAKRCGAPGFWHDELRTRKGIVDHAIEVDRILADMDQRGEYCRQISSVGCERRSCDGEARLSER